MNETHVRGLISVIIPTHNRAHYLEEALRSLERQSYRPIQVVVVDDGSTDDTRSTVEGWQTRISEDKGFSVEYYYQENQGACAARNVGIMRADGEFLQFLDSDDVLFPYATEWAVRQLTERDLDYIYFNIHRSDQNLVPLPGAYVGQRPSGTTRDICLYLWHTMGAIYRAKTVQQVGFWNEDLTGSQDWEYAARVKLGHFSFAYDPRVIGLFRNHSSERIGVASFSHHYVISVEKACESIRAHAEAAGVLDATVRRALARRLFVHAIEFGANGFEEDKQRLLAKSLALEAESGLLPAMIKGFRMVRSRRVAAGCLRLHASKSRIAAACHRNRPQFGAPLEHLQHLHGLPEGAYFRYGSPRPS